MGSRKPGVPCENAAIISAAAAGLGTICAPSRAPSAFSATQTHMDTQRCSLPFSLLDAHAHTLGAERLGPDGERCEERMSGLLIVQRTGRWRLVDDADFREREEALLVSKRPRCVLRSSHSSVILSLQTGVVLLQKEF